MRLYLVRHCEAVHPIEDAARPLSDAGRQQALRLAAWMPRAVGVVHEIRHSGVLRAAQTAEILATAARPEGGLHAVAGLRPGDPPEAAADSLRYVAHPLLVVTHLPLVANVASLLLNQPGARGDGSLNFHTGSIASLRGDGDDWNLDWLVNPEILPPA